MHMCLCVPVFPHLSVLAFSAILNCKMPYGFSDTESSSHANHWDQSLPIGKLGQTSFQDICELILAAVLIPSVVGSCFCGLEVSLCKNLSLPKLAYLKKNKFKGEHGSEVFTPTKYIVVTQFRFLYQMQKMLNIGPKEGYNFFSKHHILFSKAHRDNYMIGK